MGKYAKEVVRQAQAWLGKKENNGTHKEIIDVYNSHKPLARGYAVKYTDAWCSTFVSAVAIKLGYTDIIPTECGCDKHIELFKKLNSWIEDENVKPKAGWILFYDWSDNGIGDNKGSSDHVGIVEKVEGNTITVIEGNIDDSVGRRTLQVNGRYIRGYGVPKYDEEIIPQTTENKTYTYKDFVTDVQKCIGAKVDGIAGPETLSKTITVSAKKNNRHAVVKPIQKYLYALGYIDIGTADGIAGPKFTIAIKYYQRGNNCVADGEITAKNKTWKKLLKLA
jgi:surface antigen